MLLKLVFNTGTSLKYKENETLDFEKLLTFVRYQNNGKCLSEDELDDKFQQYYIRNKEVSTKITKKKIHSLESSGSPRAAIRCSTTSQMQEFNFKEDPKMQGIKETEVISKRRQEFLDELLSSFKDKEKWNFFFDLLVDLKESFVFTSKMIKICDT